LLHCNILLDFADAKRLCCTATRDAFYVSSQGIVTAMSENSETMSAEAAEKAYEAAAAEAVAKAEAAAAPAPLAFPAKEERAAPPAAKKPVAALAKAKAAASTPAAPAKAKPVKTAAAPRQAAPVPASTPIKPIAIKPIAIKPTKEKTMTAKKTTDFTATIKTYAAEAQTKAKAAYAKGTEVVGEVSEFTKGNVDAVVASGKILGAGLQGLGKTYAAEGKSAVETITADVKAIAAVKSPVEFVQTQSAILRKNFDHAIDFNAKTGETMLKLFGEAFAPLSVRANMMVAMVKKAA